MHPNAERVRYALVAAGARADIVEFPEGTKTSADAAAAIGTTLAQIAKTLVFLADGAPIVVIASGAGRVSEERLGQAIGRLEHLRKHGPSPEAFTFKRRFAPAGLAA